jgi:hypothetical protein
MIRLMLLAGAWSLMRRYIFRRRSRIERDTFLSKMTEKLRALARFRPRGTSPTAAAQPPLAALTAARESPGQPGPARVFQPDAARVSASSHPSSSFRSACRQRSDGFLPGF